MKCICLSSQYGHGFNASGMQINEVKKMVGIIPKGPLFAVKSFSVDSGSGIDDVCVNLELSISSFAEQACELIKYFMALSADEIAPPRLPPSLAQPVSVIMTCLSGYSELIAL